MKPLKLVIGGFLVLFLFLLWFVPVFVTGITSSPSDLRCRKEATLMEREISGKIMEVDVQRKKILWLKIENDNKWLRLNSHELKKNSKGFSPGDYIYKPPGTSYVNIVNSKGDTIQIYGGYYCDELGEER